MDSLRYVILRHQGIDDPHFDLMFETSPGSELATWRAKNWPVRTGDLLEKRLDHRPSFLNYEGPVSGNRGHVRRVEGGECYILRNDPLLFEMTCREGLELRIRRFRGETTWSCEVCEL